MLSGDIQDLCGTDTPDTPDTHVLFPPRSHGIIISHALLAGKLCSFWHIQEMNLEELGKLISALAIEVATWNSPPPPRKLSSCEVLTQHLHLQRQIWTTPHTETMAKQMGELAQMGIL